MNHIRYFVLLASMVLVGFFPSAHAQSSYSPEELAWIKANPEVTYSIDEYWPVEYLKEGQHKGLTRDFIDEIAKQTGLKFKLIQSSNWNDTLLKLEEGTLYMSTVASPRLKKSIRDKVLLSHPYIFSDAIIVTRSDTPMLFDINTLASKKVAVKGGGGYESYLRQHYPTLELMLINDPREALEALFHGAVFAVVGADIALRPIIYRKYYGTLNIAGTIADMYSVVKMPISPKYPLLHSIINKSLENMTSLKNGEIYLKWIKEVHIGRPAWQAVLKYYASEIIVFTLALLVIIALYWRAKRAEVRAVASEAEKSQFLAVMSHEIRTPMNAILATVDLLLRTPQSTRQKELTQLAKSSATNLIELLNDVLDVSKLETDKLQLSPEPTDINELATSVSDVHRLAADKKGVRLQLFTQDLADVRVHVDPLRLRQILTNLLSNAVKFTEQGSIVLKIQLSNISAENNKATLAISIKDSGIGIASEKQKRIFDAYQQADYSVANKYGGTGLGLNICRELVTLMDGSINLNSQLGVGTTISIALPVKLDTKEQASSSQTVLNTITPRFNESPAKILVVEDLAVNRQLIEEQLRELGQLCSFAQDGHAALTQLKANQHFDLILMDCNLPGMDGYQVTEHIRHFEREQGLTQTPVIAISAATSEQHKLKCIESGMDGVLTKPVTLDDLQTILDLWLEEPEPNSSQLAEVKNYHSLEELYWNTCQDDLAKLRRAIEKSEWIDIRHFVHRLKGGALTVGLDKLAEPARKLEESLMAGEHWSIEQLLSWLENYRQQLERWNTARQTSD
ncbi:ATP-binding protein [Vibrio proteolyticus]